MATAVAKTTKGVAKPKPFVEKSNDGAKSGKFVITILVEENDAYGYRKNRRKTSGQQSYFVEHLQDYFGDDYDRVYSKWAIKGVELTDEQFELAYEQL